MSERGEAIEMAEDEIEELRRENAQLRERLRMAEQTRDAAQEAGTKAVMDRRKAEEELRRLKATMSEPCSQCGSRLTLACPNCEVAG